MAGNKQILRVTRAAALRRPRSFLTVVALGIAAGAMLVGPRPVDAPEFRFYNPEYVRDHKIIPIPMMGVRGEADVLKIPPRV